jgi:hypothetical protein
VRPGKGGYRPTTDLNSNHCQQPIIGGNQGAVQEEAQGKQLHQLRPGLEGVEEGEGEAAR